MKRFPIFIAAALLLTFCSCRQKTETKYLKTSTTQEYIGTMTFRTETEYDSNGYQKTFTQYVNGEKTSRTEYTYTENSVVATITQDGETGTMKQVYEKDKDGNIVRTEVYMDDALYAVTDCTYDEKSNLLSNIQNTVAIDMTFSSFYTYDDAGNQIKIVNDYGDGNSSVIENTYDENSRLLLSVISGADGNVESREEHSWSDAGVETVHAYDTNGNLTATTYMTYDEYGNMLTSETRDENGELTLRITHTYEAFEIPVK